ncbi:hypothetical protein ACFLU6_01365 [Acidobacteriota bacterium]
MCPSADEPVLFKAGAPHQGPIPLEGDYQEKLDFICSKHILDLELGGIGIRVRVDDPKLAEHIESKYKVFLSQGSPEITLDVRVEEKVPFETLMSTFCTYRHADRTIAKFRAMAGFIDLEERFGKAIVGPDNFSQDFENYLRPVMCSITPRFNAVLFHTSAICRDGSAFVFFGPSGAGKSTITKLASKHTVMSDDMVVLVRCEDGIHAKTCGFWGGETTEYPSLKLDVPIKAFFPLHKSEENRIVRMNRSKAVLTFLLNIPSVARTVPEQEGIFDLANAIAKTCPFYDFYFCKEDDSFWEVIDSA